MSSAKHRFAVAQCGPDTRPEACRLPTLDDVRFDKLVGSQRLEPSYGDAAHRLHYRKERPL